MERPPSDSAIYEYLLADPGERDRLASVHQELFLGGMPRFLRRFDLALRPLGSSWVPELAMCDCRQHFHGEVLENMLKIWRELWREDVPAFAELYPWKIIEDSIKNCF